jgi:urease accessory protein
MGTESAHITAADFVTPPELRAWRLAANPAGRIGGLRLGLIADGPTIRLRQCYQQVPLRVLPPFPLGDGQPALLYLLNPTAGLMDGDGQRVEIEAARGVRAVIVGQSATRIHPALVGFCTQQWHVAVKRGGVLVMLPGPAIPFRGCRYYQRVEIELEEGAALVWGDIWLAGRYARGSQSEWFHFQTLVQDLTVRRCGALVFRDRFCWQGPWDAETATWHFGGAPACGTLFVTGRMQEPAPSEAKHLALGWFPTAHGDTCLRWHGPAEDVIASLVQTALQAGASTGGSVDAEPWLLTSMNLAPNHWFSAQSDGKPRQPLRASPGQ